MSQSKFSMSFDNKLCSFKNLVYKISRAYHTTINSIKSVIMNKAKTASMLIAKTLDEVMNNFCDLGKVNVNYSSITDKYEMTLAFSIQDLLNYQKETGFNSIFDVRDYILNFFKEAANACFNGYRIWLKDKATYKALISENNGGKYAI